LGFSSFKDSKGLKEGANGDEKHDCGLDAEVGKDDDADLLVLDLDKGGAHEHECPVQQVDKGN
jgi:hypothetical protein